MTVAELVATLGLDDSEFNRGIDGVKGKAGGVTSVLNGVSKAAMAGAVAAGALVVKSLDTYNDFGTSINTLTRLTGMSSEAASKLTGQWQRFGVESQSGVVATRMLAKNLDAAQQGAKPMIETFKRLGISLKEPDGKLRSIGDVLPEVRNKLSEMDNAGQRTALTLKLFGRGGADMLGWLTKSPAAIAKVNKELQGLGMVWGGKQINDWKALKDAQREMGLQWTALQLNLAQTLLPVMKTLMGYVQTGIKDWNNLSDGTQGFILKATAAAGVLGIIGPKAYGFAKAVWEIAAAVRGVGTAQAVAGAAGAAGSAGGGLAQGIAENAAASAGVGGAAKGYSALTAAKMMGGAGVTPAAYVAGTTAGAVFGAALVAAAGAVIITGVAYKLDKAAKENQESGRWTTTPSPSAGPTPGPSGSGATKATPFIDTRPAKAAIADLEARAQKLRAKLAEKFAAGKLDNGPLLEKLRATEDKLGLLRDHFGGTMAVGHVKNQLWINGINQGVTREKYFRGIMKTPMAVGHVQNALWLNGINQGLTRAQYFKSFIANPMASGHLDPSGWLGGISQAQAAFSAFKSGVAANMYVGHVVAPQIPRHALGGVFRTPHVGLVGDVPEAIVPLNNPRRAAQVMAEAGLTGRGGGTSLTFGSVSVILPPGDYGDSEDAGSAAADAFMQRTREIARGY